MATPVKLAIVHPKFDRSGGAERYAGKLAEGLSGRGHEVHVFARKADRLPVGTTFHRVPALALGRALKTWSFAWAAARRVGRSPFSVVQGFGKTTCQSVHRAGGGVHRAYLEREGVGRLSLYDRVTLGLEDRLFRSPGLCAVIAPSQWVAREIGRFYPAVEDRIRVIPNGVDTRLYCPAGAREAEQKALRDRFALPGDGALLILAATNFRLKGLDAAIRALAHLPTARLLVAGGDDPRGFQRAAEELGVATRLHFLGRIDDLRSLYRSCDLLVHPTRYDPFANVCLEALASGTPVVTTDQNGAADVLHGWRCGEVVPASADPAALAAAAGRLLAGGAERRREARQLAVLCDQERHLEVVEALYETVAAAAMERIRRRPA